jgi:uncharacterized membrane protein
VNIKFREIQYVRKLLGCNFRHLPHVLGGIEENYVNNQSDLLVSESRFETGISQMKGSCTNNLIVRFLLICIQFHHQTKEK